MAEKKKTTKTSEKKPSTPKEKKVATSQKVKTNKLELLVTIVPREKYESYQDLIQSFEVNMQMAVKGIGTAKDQLLSLLEIQGTQKTVIFSVIKQERVQDCMDALEDRFKTVKKGKGVAFTIPMSSVIGVTIYGFLSNNAKTVKE